MKGNNYEQKRCCIIILIVISLCVSCVKKNSNGTYLQDIINDETTSVTLDNEVLATAKGIIIDYKIIYDSAYQRYSSGAIEIIGQYFIVLKLDSTEDRLILRVYEDDYKRTIVGDHVEVSYTEDNKCRELSIIE